MSSRQRKAPFLPWWLHHSRERYCLGYIYSSSPDLGRGWCLSGAWCGCADTLGGGRWLVLPFDPISLVLAQRNGVEPPKKSALKPPRHLDGPTRLSHLGVSPNGTNWCVKLAYARWVNWPGKVSLTQSAGMLGLRVRGRGGWDRTATVVAPISAFLWGSTPFLCARAKKWGGIGSRGRRLLTKETAHTHKPPTSTKPPAKVGRGTSRLPTCSAHANGGDTGVKKALFFGGSTPFLWASTKEMVSNRRTGHRPPPNVSAHTYKAKKTRRGNPRRGFPLDETFIRASRSAYRAAI